MNQGGEEKICSKLFIALCQRERTSSSRRLNHVTYETDGSTPGSIYLWWSQKSRQFLVENKTKHTHSRKLVLSARIDLRWRLIVQRLMKPLLIVKREVRSQVADRVCHALVIFDVHLLIFHTAP